MIRKIREAREREEGFTLIELLVVVIIIGILAAIAIPSFLSQRESAYQADLTSAVRNFALEIEAEATKLGGSYPAADVNGLPTGVADPGAAQNTEMDYVYSTDGAGRFCLTGSHSNLDAAVYMAGYDSGQSGMLAFDETGWTCTAGAAS